ncbi:hypothetical protein CBOM_02575 [Ceraceosorus bombacis]|uniref:Uncharacterized protein n=1 Tax=Ceraceosorus bombacis TaxID=401625 RepID=A0A0P1BGV1_9BASI|nr:hypothetical protein CBOM_02575 [Ceraceosorus bombacis]
MTGAQQPQVAALQRASLHFLVRLEAIKPQALGIWKQESHNSPSQSMAHRYRSSMAAQQIPQATFPSFALRGPHTASLGAFKVRREEYFDRSLSEFRIGKYDANTRTYDLQGVECEWSVLN